MIYIYNIYKENKNMRSILIKKKGKTILTFFISLIMVLNVFLISVPFVYATDFGVDVEEGQEIVYRIENEGETEYLKINITSIEETTEIIRIEYDEYFANELTGFSNINDSANYSLQTGSYDSLFIKPAWSNFNYIISPDLILETSTSYLLAEFKEVFGSAITTSTKVEVKNYGYACEAKITYLMTKVMVLNCYYSTTGILLMYNYTTPAIGDIPEREGGIWINSELSTVPGADQDYYNSSFFAPPADTSIDTSGGGTNDSNSTNDDSIGGYPAIFLMTAAFITISSINFRKKNSVKFSKNC
jgi:hypothetical protein